MSSREHLSLLKNFSLFPAFENRIIKTIDDFSRIPKEQRGMYWLYDEAVFYATELVPCTEPLVDLQTEIQKRGSRIILSPGSTEYGGTIGGQVQLRQGALDRLFLAEEYVENESDGRYSFIVTDAYRPLALQRSHYEKIRSDYIQKEGLLGRALYERITPLIANPDLQPPHCTGGAVDLTLYEIATGEELNMGTPIDVFDTDLTWTWNNSVFDPTIRENRCLLFAAMTSAGFANAPQEWWHYSFGEREWAFRTGNIALYKPL